MSRVLAVLAVMLLALRLFTGLVYEVDDPTVFLILKRAPALFVTTVNPVERDVRRDYTVLMEDENTFPGQDGYEWLMWWAPGLAVGCTILAWLTRRRRA